MSFMKRKVEFFENILPNLMTKLVFHLHKPMNNISFVDVETTDKILSQYHSKYKQLRQHN
jgi:hypothetical protein